MEYVFPFNRDENVLNIEQERVGTKSDAHTQHKLFVGAERREGMGGTIGATQNGETT